MLPKSFIAAAALLACGCAMAQSAPYAGQQARAIKALSEQDVQELLAGQGMGLAKAAELNGYPGPAHVIEHGTALRLSPSQLEASRALMQRHQAQAREIGARLLEAERALDQAFALRSIDEKQLARLTAEAARLQGELRAEHLRTHLAQASLLDAGQIQRYAQLRGYAGAEGPPAAGPSHPHPRRH